MALTYLLNEYHTLVRMSKKRHVLVEGEADRRFLRDWWADAGLDAELKEKLSHVCIDTADILKSPDQQMGNREKVEATVLTSSEPRLVGFVDREFRDFQDITGSIADLIEDHKAQARVVWTRGHSVENYFFKPEIISKSLRRFLTDPLADEICDRFKRCFYGIALCAASISWAANLLSAVKLARAHIFPSCFKYWPRTAIIEIDFQAWENSLKARGVPPDRRRELLRLTSESMVKLQDHSNESLRWICHGHIGVRCFASAFEAITETVSEHRRKKPFARQSEDVLFNTLLSDWLALGCCTSPTLLIELLES